MILSALLVTVPTSALLQSGLDQVFIAKFALFLAVVLIWTVVWGKVLQLLLGLPIIAGQIIGGIALGPSVIDISKRAFFASPVVMVAADGNHHVSVFASDLFIFVIVLLASVLTVPYILWAAGHETDLHSMRKVGCVAIAAGVLGALLPIAGVWVVWYFNALEGWSYAQVVGLGLAFAATSVSIPVAMLTACQKMYLKSSQATLGAAVVDDIFAVILISLFVIGLQAGFFGPIEHMTLGHSAPSVTQALGAMVAVFAVLGGVGYFIISPLIDLLKRKQMFDFIAPIASAIMLFLFAFVELVGGLAGITGAYFAGLLHQFGDKQHTAQETISPFVTAILLPLYLGSIGLQIDMRLLTLHDWLLVAVLLVVAILTKLLACFAACWVSSWYESRWHPLESYLFGSSMVARGEVGLVISSILYNAHILAQQQYVIAVVIIVLTTVAAPILLNLGFIHLEKSDLTLQK